MSKSEMIQHLYDEINRQNTWYMWTVGILVALIIGFVGFLTYFQRKFSDKQVEKMKDNFKEEFNIDETRVALENANKKVKELDTLLVDTRKIEKNLSSELFDTMNNNLVTGAGTLAQINNNTTKTEINNYFFDLCALFKDLIAKKGRLKEKTTIETTAYVHIGLKNCCHQEKL